jgi:hypothetical protein
VLRRYALCGELEPGTADEMVGELSELPVRSHEHRGLVTRAFEWRADVTVYDVAYLALIGELWVGTSGSRGHTGAEGPGQEGRVAHAACNPRDSVFQAHRDLGRT